MRTVYRVGAVLVDPLQSRIERDGAAVDLQPKPLAILLHLIRHRDRIVTRDELFAAVWPGVTVGDSSLTRAVSVLRTALGDTAAGSRAIRTVARRGYRLVAPVEELREGTAAPLAPRDPFVGRDVPLAALAAAWDAARDGRGGLALVSGEPGIGKTRLAGELAAAVRAGGCRALVGFCPATGGAPPLWPFARALRGLCEDEGVEALEAAAAAARVDLGDLLPEREPPARGAPQRGAGLPGFAVLDALDRLVAALAAQRPLLLVLDDVHWADRSSLRALELLERSLGHQRVLLVATYRDTEIEPGHPLAATLAAAARGPEALRIRLGPLEAAEAGRLLAALADRPLPPGVAEAIRARGGGNPLFLRELLRVWAEGTPALEPGAPLPPGLEEVLGDRIARLAPALRELLVAAAVLGSELERDLLAEVAGSGPAAVADGLDAAVRAGWLRPVAGGVARFAFAHPLVHEALRRHATPAERLRLHERASDALVARYGARPEPVLERIAEHRLALARDGHPAPAAAVWARRAAEHAERRLAFDEAVRWFERALEGHELERARDDALRGELLLGLARTRWTVGDRIGARAPAREAAALARRLGDAALLARTALVSWVRGAAPADRDPDALPLLEEAAEKLRDVPGPLRVEVLARSAEHLASEPPTFARALEVSEEALRLARASGHDRTLYTAIYCGLFTAWAKLAAAPRHALAEELIALAERLGDPTARIQASPLHLTCLFEAGRIAEADAEIARFEGEIERLEVPAFFRWYGPLYRATCAILAGRLAEGERLALASFGLARRAHVYDAFRALASQIFQIRSDQGRLAELEPRVREMSERYPYDDSYPPLLAYVLAESDRARDARAVFEPFADRYEPDCDCNRSVTGTILANVCASLGDAPRARRLYGALAPEADLVAVNLSAWTCLGSLHWPLGKLAAAAGDAPAARRHFEEAARRNAALGARPCAARVAVDHAALCLEGGAHGEARERAEAARAQARALGMARLAGRAEALVAALGR